MNNKQLSEAITKAISILQATQSAHEADSYKVFVRDVESSALRCVGTWNTNREALSHTKTLTKSGVYHSVVWRVVSHI